MSISKKGKGGFGKCKVFRYSKSRFPTSKKGGSVHKPKSNLAQAIIVGSSSPRITHRRARLTRVAHPRPGGGWFRGDSGVHFSRLGTQYRLTTSICSKQRPSVQHWETFLAHRCKLKPLIINFGLDLMCINRSVERIVAHHPMILEIKEVQPSNSICCDFEAFLTSLSTKNWLITRRRELETNSVKRDGFLEEGWVEDIPMWPVTSEWVAWSAHGERYESIK